jgi:uncharacterized protein YcbK (DUF882 family)
MPTIDRRRFVTAVAAAIPVLALPRPALAASDPVRCLNFVHTHTGEKLTVEYARGERYFPDALAAVNHLLRDFRSGEVHAIDTDLLDLLHRLTALTETSRPFQVISGYRSAVTNAMLRGKSEGVAAHSLHLEGMAIDIRLVDVALPRLRDAALAAARGGVGYYPASNFVHVDTGRVRRW